MGIVWEAYHKGVPLLGVSENPIEQWKTNHLKMYLLLRNKRYSVVMLVFRGVI